MNVRQNILRWIEALRSGKYKQTRGCLRDEIGYCCLGVALCTLEGEWINGEHTTQLGVKSTLLHANTIRFGLYGNPNQAHLYRLNDSGVPFDEIAQFIEDNILVNFPE